MYKRIAAAVAVIILASALVVFTSRTLPRVVKNQNPEANMILQQDK